MSRRIAGVFAISVVAIGAMRAVGCSTQAPPSTSQDAPIGHVSQAIGDSYWTQVTVSLPAYDTSPPVYDPVRKVIVLATAASGTWETWEWDGAAWAMKCSGSACGLPTYGTDSYTITGTYDRVRNVLVAVGEDFVTADASTIRTLEWSGSTWATRCAEGDAGTGCGASAPERAGGVAFDQNLGRVVNFGGDLDTTTRGSLDSWDGTSWRHENTDTAHSTEDGILAFDPISKRLFLYGSDGDLTQNPSTVSYWTQAAGWVDVCGGTKPACGMQDRDVPFGGAAIDPGTGDIFVSGGQCREPACFLPRILEDEWVFDGTAWISAPCGDTFADGGTEPDCGPDLGPTHGMTFDESRREVVLIGPGAGAGPTQMWIYRAGGAACAADTDCGGAQICSTVDKVCCDQNCTDVCHTCLAATAPGICTELSHGESDDTCNNGKACGANGVCQVAAGTACTTDDVCASDHCSDGVCCSTACDGQCDVCTKALGATADGTCTNAPAGYAGNPSCGGFACNGTSPACQTTCATDADCASGFSCVSGKCEGVTCDGDHTVTTSDGTKIDCAPYKCGTADQACGKTCDSINDCSTPNVCNGSHACVAPAASSDSGGCAVGVNENRDTSRSIPTLLLGILAFALGRRRRRRA